MPAGAYTPKFEIWKGGENFTANFNNRAVSIQVDLVSGNGGGDTCAITVDDRDYLVASPHVGDGLEIHLGYEEIGLALIGTFMIDKVIFAGPPRTITITGNSVNFSGSIKSSVTQNFEKKKLSDIVSDLLKDSGYTAQIDESIGSTEIPYMNVNASPLSTLDTLARQFGGVLKFNGNTASISKRDFNTSASGESLFQTVLREEHFAEWKVEHNTRHQYDKVTARYKDPDTNKELEAVAETMSSGFLTQNGQGEGGDKVFGLKNLFPTKEFAEAAAKAKQQQLDDSLGQGQFRLAQGDPWIRDSMRLILQGFRSGIDGAYQTDMVRHIFTKDGALQTFIVTKPPNTGDTAFDTNIEGTITPEVGQVTGLYLPQTQNGNPAAQGSYAPGGA